MSGDWDYYMCLIDDAAASIFLNMELIERAPDITRSWLLSVELTMQQPREDGLSSQQEAQALYTLEDELIEQIEQATNFEYIGRLTFAGRRILYGYLSVTQSGEAEREWLEPLLQKYDDYQARYELRHDPQWLHYTQWLYPGELERAEMSNRRVVLKLQEYGDQLHVPRQVEHLIMFAARTRAALFITSMAELGYQSTSEPQAQEDGAWAVQLQRIDSVELDHINQVVHQLREHAAAHDGIYDGWGCMVVSDDP